MTSVRVSENFGRSLNYTSYASSRAPVGYFAPLAVLCGSGTFAPDECVVQAARRPCRLRKRQASRLHHAPKELYVRL